MKKIKEVKLLKDINTPETFIPKGTLGKLYTDYLGGESCKFISKITGAFYQYKLIDMEDMPDWFEIIYEDDWFEVKDTNSEHILKGNGYVSVIYDSDYVKYGNSGTREEMEYRKMYWETMYYFRKLAEELNGDWKYEAGKTYQILNFYRGKLSLNPFSVSLLGGIKFSPEVTLEQITSRAKPEMIENYIRICENPY